MHLHISFASDDNYARHLGVALESLFDNNRGFAQITVHLLSNNISTINKKNITDISVKYERNLLWYDLSHMLSLIFEKFKIPDTISITSYSRLFISELMEESVDKLIYADCDSVFMGSLESLWAMNNTEMIYGVLDHVSSGAKVKIGLNPAGNYINAGFLLINLKKWREANAEAIMMDFIKSHDGNVYHHDQGIINGCFSRQIGVLDPKYNVMTSFFDFSSVLELKRFYGIDQYYSQEQIDDAKQNPVFIHFTPGFSNRPWIKNSRHPLTHIYIKYKDRTPWSNMAQDPDKQTIIQKCLQHLFWHGGPRLFKMLLK